jgi:hypothetical protein
MVRAGKILRLRRGLYAFTDGFDPLKAAYRMHEPSYVSYQTALSYYNLIPERTEQVISVVDGRPASYLTASTRFRYHSQSRQLFAMGMSMVFIDTFPVPIATPEKALLDTLADTRLKAQKIEPSEILEFVVDGLRIEYEDLKQMSINKMKKIARLYRNHGPQKLVYELTKRQENT